MTLEKMTPADWGELAEKAHANAVAKGFYDKKPKIEHVKMLIACELAEAVEADRKGRYAVVSEEIDDYMDEAFITDFNARIKDTVEDELADVIIRCLDYVGWMIKRGEWTDKFDVPFEVYQPGGWKTKDKLIDMAYHATYRALGYVVDAMECVLSYCQFAGIDIMRHVELKMHYNELRPRLHGKKY